MEEYIVTDRVHSAWDELNDLFFVINLNMQATELIGKMSIFEWKRWDIRTQLINTLNS